MVEFVVTHMMKDFPMDLYLYGHSDTLATCDAGCCTGSRHPASSLCRRCVQIIHKLLCYQKKCRIRLHYTWRELWSGEGASKVTTFRPSLTEL